MASQSKKTLFAYVQGPDEDIVAAVEARLDALVERRKWISKDVWVVNQREPPHWDLGMNLALAAPRSRPAGWTDDVVAIATELAALHRETGRKFVIGIHDAKSDETTDIFVVDTDAPDLDGLRAALIGK
jgi:hypothetical protein